MRTDFSSAECISKLLELMREDGCPNTGDKPGSNGELALQCVFHDDNTPSLYLNLEKGVYHCLGCGAKGNLYSYLTNKRNMSKFEAGEFLSDMDNNPVRSVPKLPKIPKPVEDKDKKLWSNLPSNKGLYVYKNPLNDEIIMAVVRRPDIPPRPGKKPLKHIVFHPVNPEREPKWLGNKGKRMWITGRPKPDVLPGGLMPLYRADWLKKSPDAHIWIFEGERCCFRAQENFFTPGRDLAMTWSSGSRAAKLHNWKVIEGRSCTLVSDSDQPGRDAMSEIASILLELGCKVKVHLMPGETKEDISDWIDQGMDWAAIQEKIKPYGSVAVNKTAAPADANPAPVEPAPAPVEVEEEDAPEKTHAEKMKQVQRWRDELYNTLAENPFFEVLGRTGDLNEQAAIIRIMASKVLIRVPFSKFTAAFWKQLADFEWWLSVTGGIDRIPPWALEAIPTWIIREGNAKGRIEITAIRGRGASLESDGKVVYNLGDRILWNQRTIGLDHPELLNIYIEEDALPWSTPLEGWEEYARAMYDAVKKYRWNSKADCLAFMGWLGSCLYCGGVKWRVNLWLKSEAMAGKSWLIDEVATKLLGDHTKVISDQTKAGMAYMGGNSSLPYIFDEMPLSFFSSDFLETLKTTSGGNRHRVRADLKAHSKISMISSRVCFFFSTTSIPNLTKEIESRIVRCSFARTKLSTVDWRIVRDEILDAFTPAKCEAVRNAILMNTGDLCARVEKIIEIVDSGGDRYDRQLAALVSGVEVFVGQQGDKQVKRMMQELRNLQKLDTDETDSVSILKQILLTPVRQEWQGEQSSTAIKTLLDMLHPYSLIEVNHNEFGREKFDPARHAKKMQKEANVRAANYGFRMAEIPGEGEGEQYPHWKICMKKSPGPELPRLSKLLGFPEGTDLRDILSSMPGAHIGKNASGNNHKLRFGHAVSEYYWFDEQLLSVKLGIDFHTDGTAATFQVSDFENLDHEHPAPVL